MKKLYSFFLVLCASILLAQVNRFFYDYTYKLDSLHRENSESEMMVLDVSGNNSRFASYPKMVFDSTISATVKKSVMSGNTNFDFSGLKAGKVLWEVTKNIPEKTTLYIPISAERYALENSGKLDWKILPDKSEIEGFTVQKATIDLGGRQWIAWFASDIQIQDGPYRFCGLPGLILKLEDTKGDHVFTFKGNKKMAEVNNSDDLGKANRSRAIKVNEKKFNEQWIAYKKDPAKSFRQRNSGGNTGAGFVVVGSFNGKSMNAPEMIKKIEEEAQAKLAKENNFIELNLYR